MVWYKAVLVSDNFMIFCLSPSPVKIYNKVSGEQWRGKKVEKGKEMQAGRERGDEWLGDK